MTDKQRDAILSLCDRCIHRLPCGNESDFVQNCEFYEEPRPHGEWTSNGNDLEYICSVCGEVLPYSDEYDYKTNFCPNCGADMRRKEGEAE